MLLRLLPVALLFASSLAAQTTPIATESGKVTGTLEQASAVRSFKGIPYAAPPVGPLRWRAPEKAVPAATLLAANQFGASCMQKVRGEAIPWTKEFMVQNAISEDCLTLNIWAPAAKPAKPAAVLVFLHGGGFTEGSGGVSVYDGGALAKRGLVVVTVNYRLGIFGFFAHPDLIAESPHHSAGNYGLLDQVAALEWVKRNIAAFGGDPTRVTVAGQSAGAQSVTALISSPVAKGLFTGAIAESGATIYTASPVPMLATSAAAGKTFAAAHGDGSIAALRKIPAEELRTLPDVPREANRPNIDGWLLTARSTDELGHPVGSDVPVITGWNADEGSSSPTYGKIPAADFIKSAATRFGADAPAFDAIYPATTDAEASTSQLAAARDQNFAGVTEWAAAWNAHRKADVFLYYFDRNPPWPAHPEFKAHHTGEVPYVFDNLDRAPTRSYNAEDQKLAHDMAGYWIRFAETGRPEGPGLTPWPASRTSGEIMELGTEIGPRHFLNPKAVAFWQSYFEKAAK
jgi:para-nitrobenzyl esterase